MFKTKYLKYKNKYLELKNQTGAGTVIPQKYRIHTIYNNGGSSGYKNQCMWISIRDYLNYNRNLHYSNITVNDIRTIASQNGTRMNSTIEDWDYSKNIQALINVMKRFDLRIIICRLNEDGQTFTSSYEIDNGTGQPGSKIVHILATGLHFELITRIDDNPVLQLKHEGLKQERIYNRESRQARSEELSRILSGFPSQDSEARRRAILEAAKKRELQGKTKSQISEITKKYDRLLRAQDLRNTPPSSTHEASSLTDAVETAKKDQGKVSSLKDAVETAKKEEYHRRSRAQDLRNTPPSSTHEASKKDQGKVSSSTHETYNSQGKHKYNIGRTVVLRKGKLKTDKCPKGFILENDLIVIVTDRFLIDGKPYYIVVDRSSGVHGLDIPEENLYGDFIIGEKVFLKAGIVTISGIGDTHLDKDVPVYIRDLVIENGILNYIVSDQKNISIIYIDIPEDRLIRKAEL